MNEPLSSFAISVYKMGAKGATSDGLIEFITGTTKPELQRETVKVLRMDYDRIEIEIYPSRKKEEK